MRLQPLLENTGVLKRFALELQQLLLEMPHMELSVKMTTTEERTGINAIMINYHDEPKFIQGNIKVLVTYRGTGEGRYEVHFNGARTFSGKDLPSPAFALFKLIDSGYPFRTFHEKLHSAFGTTNVEEIDKFALKKTDNAGFVIRPPMSLAALRDKAHMLHGNDITNLQVFITSDSKLRVNAYDADSQDHEFTVDSILELQKHLAQLLVDAETA